ncbi:MAG: acetylornithine deacetylase/succinyl-diaminopimelate desuccinylase family protein [Pseudomonadota bacterium]
MKPGEQSGLFARVDGATNDLVAFTQALVRIPTTNPPGENYTPCAELLGDRLKASGFEVEYIRAEGTPGDTDRFPRINVIGRREGSGPGPCVHFNSHIDVVLAGQGWTMDPFGAEVRDGRVYGRGTCDMKGGLAASVIAAEAFIAQFPDFPGAIEISGTVDEESGGYGGVAYLAEKGFFSKPRVDHVIIPEPLNKDRVCLGHRGHWSARIETHGRIAHGSMPFLGDCAVRHMGAVLDAFEKELFPKLASKFTCMPVVPEGAKQSTMNINSIHGGEEESHEGLPAHNVPDSCRVTIDRRYLIEETLDEVQGEVTGLLDRLQRERPNFSYDISDINQIDPLMTDEGAPVPQALRSAVQDVLGVTPEWVISPGSYDQKHIARLGHLTDCVAYGPGILDLAHQPDEYVEIADMVDSAKVMALALHRLLFAQ